MAIVLVLAWMCIPGRSVAVYQSVNQDLIRVWANDGGDKVTRDELRAVSNPDSIISSVWDGTSVSIFGARNEVVSFNLILESAGSGVSGLNVSLESLTGPGGAIIATIPVQGDGVFNYLGRNIELFLVRYLQIRGLSVDLAYDYYDERHIPERCRRPWTGEGEGQGGWIDRPCRDRYYPDIAVPLELAVPFSIGAGSNQSVWCDIYIPKETPAGLYTGEIKISRNGTVIHTVPISLHVRDFNLPDLPTARTMLYYSLEDICDRYLGERYPEEGGETYRQGQAIVDTHFKVAHRHRISLITDYIDLEGMNSYWTDRLNGGLFIASRGYAGPGVGVGNNVYSIGTYGTWPWQEEGRAAMQANANAWVDWFESLGFSTPTEYFLYLIDESDDYDRTEQWAGWLKNNPGSGQRLKSMATLPLPQARTNVPSLDIPTTGLSLGIRDQWQAAADHYRADPDKRFYFYNGSRPASGSFAIEDDGVALRVNGWIQHKMGIDRWFYWESTYYLNYQCYGFGEDARTNVFRQAQTYGCYDRVDDSLGRTGWNYFNGDGVLFYPGTDSNFPGESYGVFGPFASLRLKHWRRGIQDAEYLALAAAKDPTRTSALVNRMIPMVLWENGVASLEDPTYVYCDISWPTNPDTWEAARAELADIIEGVSE